MTENINKEIELLKKKTATMCSALTDAQNNFGTDFEAYSSNMSELLVQSETFCRKIREIMSLSSVSTKEQIADVSCQIEGISVTKTPKGNYRIFLPALVAVKRKFGNCHYVCDSLNHAFETSGLEYKKLNKAQIIIEHHAPPEAKLYSVGDYDNIEVKKILDVISMYLLVDDSMQHIELFHRYVTTEKYETVITVVSKEGSEND